MQMWQPHAEQLPAGLRALSRASGLQGEWTAGGCRFGEGAGLFGKGCRDESVSSYKLRGMS